MQEIDYQLFNQFLYVKKKQNVNKVLTSQIPKFV